MEDIIFFAQAGGKDLFASFWFIIPMIAIMYFLMIAPQRKEKRKREDMLSKIKKNNRVVTAGGLHGVVVSVKADTVTLRVDASKDVRLKLNRSAISQVLESGSSSKDKEEEDEDN